jgi:thymidylate synthase ThyX
MAKNGAKPKYRVNDEAVEFARQLIDRGDYDDETEWSKAAPSADEANEEIDADGYDDFARWHLAIDTEASEGTKGRYRFPYGDFTKVNRAGLIHAKQRAAQNDHDEIEKAADDLLERLDKKRS